MDLDELAVQYFHDSLELAQKSLALGVTISATAYFVVAIAERKNSYVIPYINIATSSINCFSIISLVLFILCGIVCSYGVRNAVNNWNLIGNRDVASRLVSAPSIFLAGIYVDAALYAFFFTVGVSLITTVFDFHGWKSFVLGSVVAFPYFCSLGLTSNLRIQAFRKKGGGV